MRDKGKLMNAGYLVNSMWQTATIKAHLYLVILCTDTTFDRLIPFVKSCLIAKNSDMSFWTFREKMHRSYIFGYDRGEMNRPTDILSY